MREIKDFAKEFVMYWTGGGGYHLNDTAPPQDVIDDLTEKMTEYISELLKGGEEVI